MPCPGVEQEEARGEEGRSSCTKTNNGGEIQEEEEEEEDAKDRHLMTDTNQDH